MSNNELLQGLLDRYTSAAVSGARGADPAAVERDFDQVSRETPADDLSEGLAAAFRSDQTPPFPEMLSSLFGRSSGTQRAGIVQTLLAALGPSVLAQILGKRGLGGVLGGVLGGGRPDQISPEVAAQVPPEAIKEAAEQAERKDPSIIDRLSRIYAEQPQLVKTLGAAALAIAMARLAQRKGTL